MYCTGEYNCKVTETNLFNPSELQLATGPRRLKIRLPSRIGRRLDVDFIPVDFSEFKGGYNCFSQASALSWFNFKFVGLGSFFERDD